MDVEFNNEQQYQSTTSYGYGEHQSKSTLVRILLERGIVSTENAGTIIVVVFAVLLIVLGVLILFAGKSQVQVTYREDLPKDVIERIPPDILETFPTRAGKN